jgi:hypothetical protein
MKGPSRYVVLICEECGERTVLEGWASVRRLGDPSFGCECGERLALADRLGRRRWARGVMGCIRRHKPRRCAHDDR